MNRARVDRIADAVLYEGYILYPYRPSMKNRQRWTFGGLYPEAYCRTFGGETASNQTECLVYGTSATGIEAIVRFLHLTARVVGEAEKGARDLFDAAESATETVPDTFLGFRPVETLRVGERLFHTWQEAEAREIVLDEVTLGELVAQPRSTPFTFPGGRRVEPLRDPSGEIVGILAREQKTIEGSIEAEATEIAEGLFRLTVRVVNRTALSEAGHMTRDDASVHALVSAHTILGVQGGQFVSLLDPPEDCCEAAAGCRNVGVWPVLVGAEGQTDTMLSSPIILYDHPQIAPESPGDFFDGAEIDEMLTLRILTLTEDEKLAMAAVDERARSLLARTEKLGPEQMRGLHGTIRSLRPVPEEDAHG